MKKKICVIGSSGYIGSKLVLALEDVGHDVSLFDLPKNILSLEELQTAIAGQDVVFLLAAMAELSWTDAHPQETVDVNIVGASNVSRICAENNVVLNFASTSCIYGEPLETPSVEDKLIHPSDTYAESKAAAEHVVKLWGLSKGLKANILRFDTVFGQGVNPSQRSDMAIQKFIKAAVDHKDIRIDWDGEQNRTFIHIDDLVRAMVLIVDKEIVGETINLAGKESISINDIAEYAIKFGATGKTYGPKRKDDFHDQDVSIEKAKRLLDWEPEITFEEGITSFFEWLKKQ